MREVRYCEVAHFSYLLSPAEYETRMKYSANTSKIQRDSRQEKITRILHREDCGILHREDCGILHRENHIAKNLKKLAHLKRNI